MCDTTLSNVCHDSCVCNSGPKCETWQDSFICDIPRLVVIWDMTRACGTWLMHVGHDLFLYDMIDLCNMTHSSVTWLIFCITSLTHVWHDSFTWRDSFMCDVTYDFICDSWVRVWRDSWLIHVRHGSFMCDIPLSWIYLDTGWRRLIGSLIFIGHFPQK